LLGTTRLSHNTGICPIASNRTSLMSDYFVTAAPRVEEATVDRAETVGAASATAAAWTEPATVTPVAAVEPAVMYTTPATTVDVAKGLPASQVRGETGADFESDAAVLRGTANKNILQVLLPCLYEERDFVAYGEVKYYVLVKEGLCYVYVDESDPSPLYAIELDKYFAVQEDPRKPEKGSITISPLPNTNLPRESMKTVLLKNKSNGKQAYQFTFDTEKDPSLHKLFYDLVDDSKKKGSKAVAATAIPAAQKTS
jgi:hypothetical protein